MDFIGEISVEPRSTSFTKNQWIDVIRVHPNLVSIPPREGINPFTKERVTFPARLNAAHVVVDGKNVGSMSWAEDDSARIIVFGEPQSVLLMAHDVARSLGGRFESAGASTARVDNG